MLVFALLVIMIFNFALELDAKTRTSVTSGVLWVTFAFAGVLSQNRTFALEKERGCLHGLMLCPVDRSVIYAGKMFSSLLYMLFIEIIVLPVYFMTSVMPFTYSARKAEIARLEARHQELSRDLEKARLLVRNLERVEQEYQILHQQWQVAQTLLPEANEMPILLRKVTAAGQQSGVVFELFRPNPAINKGFYADNPVEVKVRGGYHQTGVFLSRLANLNRIVNVADLQMKGLEKQENQPQTVETSMTLTAYTLGGGLPAEPQDAQQQLAAKGNKAKQPARKRPQASSH